LPPLQELAIYPDRGVRNRSSSDLLSIRSREGRADHRTHRYNGGGSSPTGMIELLDRGDSIRVRR